MLSKSLRDELLATAMDDYDQLEPDPVAHELPMTPKNPSTRNSILKSTYVNQGFDTSKLFVPKEQSELDNNTKLILDNAPIPIDETIPTYGRSGKKAYKEVQYNQEYHPPEFTSPGTGEKKVRFNDTDTQDEIKGDRGAPRRSLRLKEKARTKWRPTKIAQIVLSTLVTALLVSNCIYTEPAKPL